MAGKRVVKTVGYEAQVFGETREFATRAEAVAFCEAQATYRTYGAYIWEKRVWVTA